MQQNSPSPPSAPLQEQQHQIQGQVDDSQNQGQDQSSLPPPPPSREDHQEEEQEQEQEYNDAPPPSSQLVKYERKIPSRNPDGFNIERVILPRGISFPQDNQEFSPARGQYLQGQGREQARLAYQQSAQQPSRQPQQQHQHRSPNQPPRPQTQESITTVNPPSFPSIETPNKNKFANPPPSPNIQVQSSPAQTPNRPTDPTSRLPTDPVLPIRNKQSNEGTTYTLTSPPGGKVNLGRKPSKGLGGQFKVPWPAGSPHCEKEKAKEASENGPANGEEQRREQSEVAREPSMEEQQIREALNASAQKAAAQKRAKAVQEGLGQSSVDHENINRQNNQQIDNRPRPQKSSQIPISFPSQGSKSVYQLKAARQAHSPAKQQPLPVQYQGQQQQPIRPSSNNGQPVHRRTPPSVSNNNNDQEAQQGQTQDSSRCGVQGQGNDRAQYEDHADNIPKHRNRAQQGSSPSPHHHQAQPEYMGQHRQDYIHPNSREYENDQQPEPPVYAHDYANQDNHHIEAQGGKRVRDQNQDQNDDVFQSNPKRRKNEIVPASSETEAQKHEGQGDLPTFDAFAEIEKYDYVKDLQEPWNEMMDEMIPFIDGWAEKYLSTTLDTIYSMYGCFYNMSKQNAESLEVGVGDILEYQDTQNQIRQTLVDFRRGVADISDRLMTKPTGSRGNTPHSGGK